MRRVTDSELIDQLGGPAKLAATLGYDKREGGVQRVHNWRTRGIPAAVRLEHRALFDAALLCAPELGAEGAPTVADTEGARRAA